MEEEAYLYRRQVYEVAQRGGRERESVERFVKGMTGVLILRQLNGQHWSHCRSLVWLSWKAII